MTLRFWIAFIVFISSAVSSADTSLSARSDALKKQVIELNKELYALEEEILYPANTQLVVFVALDDNVGFELDSVELLLNGKLATSYLYSDRELSALQKGGVQRLYVGTVSTGAHQVEAIFNGRGSDDKYFRKAATLSFEKSNAAKYLELRVERTSGRLPGFTVKELR